MKLGMSMLAGHVPWHGAAWCSKHSPSGQDSRRAWLLPLLAVVAQRAAQRPGRRQPLRGQLERDFVERAEMGGVAAAERQLGHQAAGAGEQGAHRIAFGVVGELPMPVERAAGLAQQARALGHHHQRGRHGHDAGRGERQRSARYVGRGQRQEAAQAVVEDEHRVLACHLNATAPGVDLRAAGSVNGRARPGRAA